MISQTEQIAFTQVLNILNNIESEYYEKIPKDIIELFTQNNIEYYQYYDENGQTKISDLAEQILCYLNLEYWCNEQEKKILIEKYKKNDENLERKYDISSIFERKEKVKQESRNNEKKEELQLIEYKQNWIMKLINKIISRWNNYGKK